MRATIILNPRIIVNIFQEHKPNKTLSYLLIFRKNASYIHHDIPRCSRHMMRINTIDISLPCTSLFTAEKLVYDNFIYSQCTSLCLSSLTTFSNTSGRLSLK